MNFLGFIWKADVRKFFDSVSHSILLQIISRKIKHAGSFQLIQKIISSFSAQSITQRERERESLLGMPIGNLTSQIFANIYLNELDRFVKHELKPRAYLRYGDDFVLIENDPEKLAVFRSRSIHFLKDQLGLNINPKNDCILKMRHGLKFLGVLIFPERRWLNRRNHRRIFRRLNPLNVGSYYGLLQKHDSRELMKEFQWGCAEKFI